MDDVSQRLSAVGRSISEFSVLREAKLFLEEDADGFPDPCVDITLSTSAAKEELLSFRAVGVRSFRLKFSGRPIQVQGLAIESLADRQLERIRWEVTDDEDDTVAFQCHDLRVLDLTVGESRPDRDG